MSGKKNYTTTQYWCVGDSEIPRDSDFGQLSVSISSITGDVEAKGTVTNAGFPTSITVWLTDADGDQTFGTASLSPPDNPTSWSASFIPMPFGEEYSFTVQVQYSNQIANQSTDYTIQSPPPPPPPPPPSQR